MLAFRFPSFSTGSIGDGGKERRCQIGFPSCIKGAEALAKDAPSNGTLLQARFDEVDLVVCQSLDEAIVRSALQSLALVAGRKSGNEAREEEEERAP